MESKQKVKEKQDTITAGTSFPLKEAVTDLASGSSGKKKHREVHVLATNSFSNSILIL